MSDESQPDPLRWLFTILIQGAANGSRTILLRWRESLWEAQYFAPQEREGHPMTPLPGSSLDAVNGYLQLFRGGQLPSTVATLNCIDPESWRVIFPSHGPNMAELTRLRDSLLSPSRQDITPPVPTT